jgi:lysine-N-methylase
MPAAVTNELRIFSMNLMRTRELPLWQRLALLGTFCDALDRDCANGEADVAQALIDEFTRNIENGSLLDALDPVQPGHEAQAMVFATLWASKGFASRSPHQQALMARIATGLGGDTRGMVSGVELVAAYRRGLDRLDEAMREVPWLLDHFLLNEMFALQFPVGAASAYDSFLRLSARFGLLRLLLAAQCNAGQEIPSVRTLAATVALQARRFQHDAKFAEEVNLSLRDSGWANLERLYTLLRT